jgi:hypothetical protein
MSSSPWRILRNGDEDVATPFHEEARARCVQLDVNPDPERDGTSGVVASSSSERAFRRQGLKAKEANKR